MLWSVVCFLVPPLVSEYPVCVKQRKVTVTGINLRFNYCEADVKFKCAHAVEMFKGTHSAVVSVAGGYCSFPIEIQ